MSTVDSTPAVTWAKLIGSSGNDFGYAITLSGDQSIYVAGYTTANLNGQTNSGEHDSFVVRLTLEGDIVWTKLLGTARGEVAYALGSSNDNSVYVAGYTTGDLGGQKKTQFF